jgi:branched-subunit amino acid transport protein
MTEGGLGSGFIWIAIGLIGAGTFAIRLSFIQLFEFVNEVPDWLEDALQLIPAAVLPAIILPHFVTLEPALTLTFANEKLVAGAVAAVVAWRTESMIATLAVGMGTLWVLLFMI